MRIALVAVLSVQAVVAQAQIYKCTGADGKINFTDSPCTTGQQVEKLERVPPQGLDKLFIELKQKQAGHEKFRVEHEARQAQWEREKRAMYMSRRMHEGLRIGMTEEEVEALPHWRWAESQNVTESARGVREQRVFRASHDNEYERMYLYFVNGILTVIQD